MNKLWQGVPDLASELLEDQARDRAAMRIPFKGSFDDPKADIWSAIGSLVSGILSPAAPGASARL